MWNNHFLKPFESNVHPDWCLYAVHGFVAQSIVSVVGRPIYVTLIARRSKYVAQAPPRTPLELCRMEPLRPNHRFP